MILKPAYYSAGAAWAAATKLFPVGRNIYQDEWDVCIVLDSARADLFGQIAPYYLPILSADYAWSRGSITTEWLTQTFREPFEGEIANTAFLTANPHSETVFTRKHWLTNQADVRVTYPSNPAVDPDAFADYVELWRTHATSETHGAVPPDVMADATIELWQTSDHRIVSFWLQPHEPFIAPESPITGGTPTEKNIWKDLQSGHLDPRDVWVSYRENLRHALKNVRRVLDSIDADVLVTADHGNLFGELGQFGHPFGMPHPAVRRVPWCRCPAIAIEDHTPRGIVDRSASAAVDREEQLAALGYR